MHYVVADIGGTNTTIGLMKVDQNILNPRFELLFHKSYKSREIKGIMPALIDAIRFFTQEFKLESSPHINISACGPTDGLSCHPTNLPDSSWLIEKHVIEKHFSSQVYLINDFAAIAYSLMTIYEHNDPRIAHITPSPSAIFSSESSNIKVVLGAGTGLGCATLHCHNGNVALIPSEGGWLDYSPSPRNKYELQYLFFLSSLNPDGTQSTKNRPLAYSWEDAICASRGINNIYRFFCDESFSQDIISVTQRAFLKSEFDLIEARNRPIQISKYAQEGNIACIRILSFWIALYAKCARQVACLSLPYGGFFIGGGAAAKNIPLFLQDNLFYDNFNQNINPNILKLMNKVPLYIIKEYIISLYGNAYHLYSQLRKR